MNRTQKGFGHLIIIIAVLVIAAVAGSGYLVYKNHNKKAESSVTSAPSAIKASNESTAATTQAAADPVAGWISYNDSAGYFSLKYPPNWVTATNPELCGSLSLLLLGTSKETVGKCGSDSTSEITIYAGRKSSTTAPVTYSTENYTDIKKETVIISGLSATKSSATKTTDESLLGDVPKGTLRVEYYAEKGNNYYGISYNRLPSYPDATTDLSTLVTQSFKVLK